MRLILLLLLTQLFLGSALAQGIHSGMNQACLDYIKSLPIEVEYDFVMAPEDWNHPETSPKIPIFYYAPNLKQMITSGVTPYVYYNGGPGSSSHGIYEYFKKNMPETLSVPFLYMDQRGTGCSGAYPTVAVTLQGARRLALYGTRNIVLDSELIRKKLFPDNRPWRAFGQSFGGYIVHRYISIAPNSLLKAIVHGSSLKTDGITWVENRILSQKRRGSDYAAQFPKDEAILQKARNIFPKDYCLGNKTVTLCGAGILDTFGFRTLQFPKSWASLHGAISKLLNSDGTLNLEFIKIVFPPIIRATDSMMDFLIAVVPGMELPGGLANQWSCGPATQRLRARGEEPRNWMFNECRITENAQASYDLFLSDILKKDYLAPQGLKQGLLSNRKLQFHLYSGELDSMVPRESFDEEVGMLRRLVKYKNLSDVGHDWVNSKEIWDELKRP